MTSFRALLLLVLVVVISVTFGQSLSSSGPQDPVTPDSLTVHEWGTFTAVVGREGGLLEWRPIFKESDLPSFVHSVDRRSREYDYPSKSSTFVRVRMETPVIYFYSPHELMVNVKTSFPFGRMTEWYPHANRLSRSSLEWDAKVVPSESVQLTREDEANHYYAARETDAALLTVTQEGKTEHEKFLFYRGVGNFALPIEVRLKESVLQIKRAEGSSVPRAIIFENRGGRIGYGLAHLSSNESDFARPTLNNDLSSLREEMKAMLIAAGLYPREAEAMLETWSTSWFEEGLRVLYLVPRSTVDKILPLNVNPKPESLERGFVGRMELISTETETQIRTQLSLLDDQSPVVQQAAKKTLGRYGRFLESILLEVRLHTADEDLKTRIDRFIAARRSE